MQITMADKDYNENRLFTKKKSVMLSGIAVMLMVYHHLFLFGTWRINEVGWDYWFGHIGMGLSEYTAQFGSICVPIFAFMSGYAMWINKKGYSSWQSRMKRLGKFLLIYWVTCALFLLIGYFADDTLPTPFQFIKNLFGISTGPKIWINVPFAWYVTYYIEFILLTPLLMRLFSGKSVWSDIGAYVIVIAGCFVNFEIIRELPVIKDSKTLSYILWVIKPLMASCLGIIVAKHALIDKAHRHCLQRIPAILCMIILLAYMYADNKLWISGVHDLVFTLLRAFIGATTTIVLISILSRPRITLLEPVLLTIGRFSLYIWFLHGLIFAGHTYLQPWIYAAREPMLIFIVCMATILPMAYLLNLTATQVLKLLGSLVHKIQRVRA